MKIQLTNIENNIFDNETKPELKFLLEFEVQKNSSIRVPFYYDCLASELFLTEINLSTGKVENKPFEFALFSKNSLLNLTLSKPIEGMKEWIPDWHSGSFVKGYTVKKFMEEQEVKATVQALQIWWDNNADNILTLIKTNKKIYNDMLESALSKLKIV